MTPTRAPDASAIPAEQSGAPVRSDAIADPADRLRGRLMAQALGAVLDRARGAREVLPHLAALERTLLEAGAHATAMVPPHWLGRICSQLASLPLPSDDAALHDLLDRLRERLDAQRTDWQAGDGPESERTVVIREISHSEFAAAENEQATTITCDRL